jgi:hypothetical protein
MLPVRGDQASRSDRERNLRNRTTPPRPTIMISPNSGP